MEIIIIIMTQLSKIVEMVIIMIIRIQATLFQEQTTITVKTKKISTMKSCMTRGNIAMTAETV